MAPWLRGSYAALARTAEVTAAIAATIAPASARSKVLRALQARRGLLEQYERWGAAHRDATRPLLWVHAASVGEGLMALPVLQRIRDARPDVQIAYTFFSPSAERFAHTVPADFTAYLPFDTPRSMSRALDALRPTALVFSKVDVWPTLATRAHRNRVALGLISAALPETSSRRNGMSAALTREAYATLDLVGATSADDATRLIELGVSPSRVRVTGDTRYDQAWARAHVTRPNGTLVQALQSERPTLVAGSTWRADEDVLLPAWARLLQTHPAARLLIAPHELAPSHIARLERWARDAGLGVLRLDPPGDAGINIPDAENLNADIVIVNRMGVLADLYALATIAYVGGGFHDAGLHSMVEPAVFSAPVLIGPRNRASRDAQLMVGAGGAAVITNVDDAAATMCELVDDAEARQRMSTALAAVVSGELGAGDRSFELVGELLALV